VSFSWTRVRAIFVKDLRDYRRNRFVVGTMTVLPLLFVVLPLIQVFHAYAHVHSTNLSLHVGVSMLCMLALISLNVITVSSGLAIGLAAVLLAIDLLAWRVVAAMFDRERLITGRRA
jgi:hypothetical protein